MKIASGRSGDSLRRSWLFVAAAVALGVVSGLAALEIATRALGIAPPLPSGGFVADSVLPWKMEVHGEQRQRTEEFDVDYTQNSLGFRGHDRPFEKPPGAFRIVGIGDSFTYGIGVDHDATYLARLEAALGARTARRVEVINLGIPRYWPEPEALVLEHYGLKFHPDLVIVGVTTNDIEDTRTGRRLPSVSRGYLVTDRLGDWAEVGRWLYIRSDVARVLIHALTDDAQDVERALEDEPAIWTRMEEAFDRMVRLSAGVDAEIIFLYIPHRGAWRTVEADEVLTPGHTGGWPLPRPAARPVLTLPARLRRFCAARDCEFVDILPAMRAHPQPDSLHHQKDGHCTEAGNGLIAEVLGRELEERRLFPSDGAASRLPGAAR